MSWMDLASCPRLGFSARNAPREVERPRHVWPWRIAALVSVAAAVACVVPGLAVAASGPSARGVELVSPADKGGADILPGSPVQAGLDGAVTYEASAALPGSTSSPLYNDYLARRGDTRWTTQSISPPVTVAATPIAHYEWWSPDLSFAVLNSQVDPPLAPGALTGVPNLYLRNNVGGTYTALTNVQPPNPPDPNGGSYRPTVEGVSADGRHVVFSALDALTPEAPGGYAEDLYEWVNGTIRFVAILPDGSAAPQSSASFGGPTGTYRNTISADGSKIFFTSLPWRDASGGTLYVRIDGTSTVQVNASQKTNGSGPGGTDPNGPQMASYAGATSDGSHAFFLSTEQLTNDSTAANGGQDLYDYDVASGDLTDLTVDHHGNPSGADVRAVLGTSDDGQYAYFVAGGVLDDGATQGQYNLYAWHRGGGIHFIGTMDQWGDSLNWIFGQSLEAFRMTPDGRHMIVQSVARLTGYDNTDASTGAADSEIYRYDAEQDHLACVSCNPAGRPHGASTIAYSVGHFKTSPTNLSADGEHVFFTSTDSLVDGDTNGQQDVYEYADGGLALISSGHGDADSQFADASPDGVDVYFQTRDQLVHADQDHAADLYDARLGGGFPDAADSGIAPCSGDACRSPGTAPPALDAVGSIAFDGFGNSSTPSGSAAKALRVAGLSASARRALARTGQVALRVTVTGGGTVSARLRALVGKRFAAAGLRTVTVRGTERQTVSLKLQLSAAARRALAAHRRLRVSITVSLAGAVPQRAAFTLVKGGRS